MFTENKKHFQQELFNSFSSINPKLQEKLKNSWAAVYYEHVFCKIDEKPFAPLYCSDNGRPNFPINILLSLEFIKNIKDWSDEEVLEQFSFNYQIMYALGERDLSELYLAPRTLYYFRDRVYHYALENPDKEDLVFGQFEKLTGHFLGVTKTNTKEQRIDTTGIRANIKRAGRLSLAFDVLHQAVSACPKELLTDSLKKVLEADFKTEVLYRTRTTALESKIQSLINLCVELLAIVKVHNDICKLEKMQILDRFLKEQAKYDEGQNSWIAKENKEISPKSLQSAYEPNATFREKAGKKESGYVLELADTCGKENTKQFITDYALETNTTADVDIIQKRLPKIKENTDLTDMHTDGGFYSEKVEEKAKELNVNMHYTDMTGKTPDVEKISVSAFEIDAEKIIKACPTGKAPARASFNERSGVLTAHFSCVECVGCPNVDKCPVKIQKKDAVVRINKKSLTAAQTREKVKKERKESCSKRAAIEGTNSALKRGEGAGRLNVRGIVKGRIVIGYKVIGRNFKQLCGYFKEIARKILALPSELTNQGISVSL